MRSMIDIAKRELYRGLSGKGIFLDLLLDSGFEALELAKFCTGGIVYAFGGGADIEATCKLFESVAQDNIRLINDTPDNLEVYLAGKINVAICRARDFMSVSSEIIQKAIIITLNNLVAGGRLLVLLQDKQSGIITMLNDLPIREYSMLTFDSPNDMYSPIGILVEKR